MNMVTRRWKLRVEVNAISVNQAQENTYSHVAVQMNKMTHVQRECMLIVSLKTENKSSGVKVSEALAKHCNKNGICNATG